MEQQSLTSLPVAIKFEPDISIEVPPDPPDDPTTSFSIKTEGEPDIGDEFQGHVAEVPVSSKSTSNVPVKRYKPHGCSYCKKSFRSHSGLTLHQLCHTGKKRNPSNSQNDELFTDDVDVVLFIKRVKTYPEIWNAADDNYHDRAKKREAWYNVCQCFIDHFEEKEDREKNEICYKLIKKWKNIRDGYFRSVKNKGRRYVYARQLLFLTTTPTSTEAQSSLDAIVEGVSLDPEQSDELPVVNGKQRAEQSLRHEQSASKKRKRELESSLIDLMKKHSSPHSLSVTAPEPNPDMSFFQSLIPSIKDFTEDQKLELRCEILNVIRRMRMSPSTRNNAGPIFSGNMCQPNSTPLNALIQFTAYPPQIGQSSAHLMRHDTSKSQSENNYFDPQGTPLPSDYRCNLSRQSSAEQISGRPLPSGLSQNSVGNCTHTEEENIDLFQ